LFFFVFLQLFRFLLTFGIFTGIQGIRALIQRHVWRNTVIEIDLSAIQVQEVPQPGLFRFATPNRIVFSEFVTALYKLAEIDNVRAIVFKFGGVATPFGIAQIQEVRTRTKRKKKINHCLSFFFQIREAIATLNSKNKVTVAWAHSFGELDNHTLQYYLASACQHIFVAPSGHVSIARLLSAMPFFKKALEMLEIDPEFEQRKKYKVKRKERERERERERLNFLSPSSLFSECREFLYRKIFHSRTS
jgi:hypothetical protein